MRYCQQTAAARRQHRRGTYLLAAVIEPGVTLTQDEIAAACGCSKALIYLIEKQALQKIRREFKRRGITEAS